MRCNPAKLDGAPERQKYIHVSFVQQDMTHIQTFYVNILCARVELEASNYSTTEPSPFKYRFV